MEIVAFLGCFGKVEEHEIGSRIGSEYAVEWVFVSFKIHDLGFIGIFQCAICCGYLGAVAYEKGIGCAELLPLRVVRNEFQHGFISLFVGIGSPRKLARQCSHAE